MKFSFQRYNMIDTIANDLKALNDKIKIINRFFYANTYFASNTKDFRTASPYQKSLQESICLACTAISQSLLKRDLR